MALNVSIQAEVANKTLEIKGYPDGLAFYTEPKSQEFVVAKPSTEAPIIPNSSIVNYSLTSDTTPSAEVINIGSSLNITLGTILNNKTYDELDAFKYLYPNFVDSGINFQPGDVVYLEEDLSSSANEWKAKCKKADTNDEFKGAFNSLYIFQEHVQNNLVLISRGYFDLEDEMIEQWTAGRTLYLDRDNKFHITPSEIKSGGWVRSIGSCIPNTENKKRIWFEPDSTFIKIN